jgi:hypothetical protein
MAEQQRSLTAELQELFLVALGAVPGALLRWQVALHGSDRHLLVNVLGAALLGFARRLARSATSSALDWDWFLWIPHHLQQLDVGGDAIDQRWKDC